ncbi:helicase-related protein (plasmid) [Myroides albus]|uniref:helicase-related protein n=1 Tax=Myroides albus TaxID=2562892 RepID=UPI00215974CC|nr:helicase-related protein [Myroides albus]UVD81425.1 helicase-related protein [Myroides albus]
MTYNIRKQLERAIQAITAAYEVNSKMRSLTEEDVDLINSFKGFGGIKALLIPTNIEHWISISNISKADLEIEKDVKSFYSSLKTLFGDEFFKIEQSIKESVLTSFYTDRSIVDAIFSNYKVYNTNEPIHFLEPSAGNGVFVDSALKHFPNIELITAIEKDTLTAYMLQAKYANNERVKVINRGFEEVDFKNQRFDLIASNIPFGEFTVNYKEYSKEVTSKIHNFFFFHSRNLLKENGQLSFITSSGVFNSRGNMEFRKQLLTDKLQITKLMTLPSNLFRSAGTEVTSHLVNAIANTGMSVTEQEINSIFIPSIKNDDNITLNNYIHRYENLSFYKTPSAVSNPYGEFEYAYKVENLEELVNFMNKDNLGFKNLQAIDIQEEFKGKKINYEYCDSKELTELEREEELKYLRIDTLNSEQKKNFSLLGLIKANYKGKSIVLASMAKTVFVEENKFVTRYILDSYIDNQDLYIPKRELLTAKGYKSEFDLYLTSLVSFSKEYALEISVQNNAALSDSVSFKEWFLGKFTQPQLKYYYKDYKDIPYFDNRGNIQEIVQNEHFIYNDTVWRVNGIIEVLNQDDILEIEKIEIKNVEKIKAYFSFLQKHLEYSLLIKNYREKDTIENWNKLELANGEYNALYDSFVNQYAAFSFNKRELIRYDSINLSQILALENEIEVPGLDLFSNTIDYHKSDIFDIGYIKKLTKKEVLTTDKALIKSFGNNQIVDLNEIAKLTGKDVEQILEELDNKIIFDPLLQDYNLRSVFLSGDIYEKIDEVNALVDFESKEEILEELRKVLPEEIAYNAISKQLGSRWINIEYYHDFVNDYFDSKFLINFDLNTDTLLIESVDKGIKYNTYQCENGRYIYPEDIFYNAFYSTYPVVKYSVGDGDDKVWYTDHAATNYYKKEIDKIRKAFDSHLLTLDPQIKDLLSNKYNRLYNSFVEQKIDTELLDLSDMRIENLGVDEIYTHQKESIWATVMREGGVVDHEVGLGKTLSLAGTAKTLKKFRVANKPVILALKANVAEIAKTYELLYPNSKVLYAAPKDYVKANREVFLNKIKNNDWDVVVMSHEQFGKIPQSETVSLSLIEKELELIERNLTSAGDSFSKKQLRGLEVRKNNLRNRRLALQDSISEKTDKGVLSFEELGIDHILIDESHQFKNLSFTTRHQRVAGLGQTDGNAKTDNLLTAIRTIQHLYTKGNYGATFYSGTPITNSLTELYLIQKYLIPNELEKRGLLNFDSWAANFCIKTVEFEANMVNDIVSKERFRFFINVPELSMLYKSMAHVATASNIPNFDRPNRNDSLLMTDQTPLQERFYRKLAKFLKDGNQERLNLEVSLNLDSKNTALSITAMNLALKASLDMRLINSEYPDEFNNKINTMVRDVVKNYNEFDQQKNTQCIFSDLGTSKKKLSFDLMDENYHKGFFTSIYDDIKYKLIASGIDEKEIAFVQDWDNKKVQLSDKMNKGEIRILIGGTQNAGTGLNIQKRLSNIYHFSIPWKPSELEQRDGRAVRKGNWIAKEFKNNEVDIKILATANTLDNYKVELNKNKQRFIEQLRTASVTKIRVMDEGDISEDTGMNLAEIQAQLSGDNTVLTLTKVEKKIKDLTDEKHFVINERENNKLRRDNNEYKITKLELQKEHYGVDYHTLKELKTKELDKDYTDTDKPIVKYTGLSTEKSKDTEAIYSYIEKLDKEVKSKHFSERTIIATYGCFQLYAVNTFADVSYRLSKENNYEHYYVANEGRMNFESKSSVRNYIHFCLNNIEKRYERAAIEIENLKEVNQKLTYNIENKVFSEEQDKILQNLEKEAEGLREQIRENNSKEPSFEKKNVKIEHDFHEVKIVDSLAKLQQGLLEDLLGSEYTQTGMLVSNEVLAAVRLLIERDSMEAFFHTDLDDTYTFVQYTIFDSDQLYVDFKDLKEVDIIEELELVNKKSKQQGI